MNNIKWTLILIWYKIRLKKYNHDIHNDCDIYGCQDCDYGICKGISYFK